MNSGTYFFFGLLQLLAGGGGLWVIYHLLSMLLSGSVFHAEPLVHLLLTWGYFRHHRRDIPLDPGKEPHRARRGVAFLLFPASANVLLVILWYALGRWDFSVAIALLAGFLAAKLFHFTMFRGDL